ncbi:putative protein kinase RLK-Pelle-DLSV family [Medicago truncatula]|nr:putative protein kinase RLK-Pelle-DLSV family [Medicago truncatula]
MSLEYAMEGVFSTKSDVYSFGVMLLEIISDGKNNSFYSDDNPLNLVGHLWKKGKVLQLVDSALKGSFSEEEVLRCVHIGILCVEENADDRPTMVEQVRARKKRLLKKSAWNLRIKIRVPV